MFSDIKFHVDALFIAIRIQFVTILLTIANFILIINLKSAISYTILIIIKMANSILKGMIFIASNHLLSLQFLPLIIGL